MTNSEQRRLRRSVALHVLAVVVFALLAMSGAGMAAPGLLGLAVPLIVAGVAGAAGAAAIAVSVWRACGEAGTGVEPSGAPQRNIRLAMAAAAVVVLLSGVLLAPSGIDRGFVISVAALLAAVLALFALLAGDRPRTDRAGSPR